MRRLIWHAGALFTAQVAYRPSSTLAGFTTQPRATGQSSVTHLYLYYMQSTCQRDVQRAWPYFEHNTESSIRLAFGEQITSHVS